MKVRALAAQLAAHRRDVEVDSALGDERRRDARRVACGEGRAHDAQRGARHAVAVEVAPSREEVVGVGAAQGAQRNVVIAVARDEVPLGAHARAGVVLDGPGACCDGVGEARPREHLFGAYLVASDDVPRLACAELGPRGDEVRVRATWQQPDGIEVRLRLVARAGLGAAHVARVASVVALVDQVRDDVARDGQARYQAVLGQQRADAALARFSNGIAHALARDVDRHRNAPDAQPERAVLYETVVAVAHFGTREGREIGFARRVHEGAPLDLAQATVVGDPDGRDEVALAPGVDDLRVQEHLDAGPGAEPVEHALRALWVEHHRDRREATWFAHRSERAQFGQHVFGDTEDDLPRRVFTGINAAIREHVAQRRCAAEARPALDE